MNKPPLIFIVVMAIIVVAASLRFMQQRRQNAADDGAPLVTKSVAVAAKREFPASDRRSRQREVTPAGEQMRYEVRFRPLQGGMETAYRVSAQQYHGIAVGERGVLSVKGSRFVAFAPEAAH